jgi:hypothetical protein
MTAARTIWHLSRDDSSDETELVVPMPIKILSEANLRNGHMARWRRGKAQKQVVGFILPSHLTSTHKTPPLVITLVRLIGKGGQRLDDDNNVGGFKAVRDAVAACLGIDDGDKRLTWICEQRRDTPAVWGIEVRIRAVRS